MLAHREEDYNFFSLKVYGAVDLIIAVNKCTMNTLSSISSPSSSIFSWALTPFYSRPSITCKVIREAFVDSMITLAGLVENLIILAEVEVMNIDRLEEHLSLLHVLTVQEDTAISSAKTELLRDIWTSFGGNRQMLKGYDKNLELLHGIGGVRRQAWAHVTLTLRLLKQLCGDMEVMQKTLSSPKLPGVPISIEAHIRSIKLGVERLKDSRAIARKKDEEDVSKKIFDCEGTKIIYVGSVP
ncbi:hypothetical protein BDP27DRAFT_1365596 [Rhodocollybia butyracea]|uniref:Uncharacterized protein n=1 Tax=Rhodocollybia butyracea TaxID=206335 RepID=A0A9P5U526_9AGAR|nr:hypothetical protein BDP27DRAFT_1365596 [Rhodocollybia butyracea]